MSPRNDQRPSEPRWPSPSEIVQQIRKPQMRAADDPLLMRAATRAIRHPGNPHVQQLFSRRMERQAWKAALTMDPYYGAYPPLTTPYSFDLFAVDLPDGRPFGLSIDSAFRNIGVVGPTGKGKSSMLRLLLIQLVALGCVIVFDRKRELRMLAGIPHWGQHWFVLSWTELKLSLLQPPVGVSREIWFTEIVSLIARSYSLYASARPLLELLHRAHQVQGEDVNLSSWIKQLRSWEPGKGFREQGYKESSLAVLTSLRRSVGILDYAKSNCIELLFSAQRGLIIETDTLPVEHVAFFVSLLIRFAYLWRLHAK
jgi:hypothetical protein